MWELAKGFDEFQQGLAVVESTWAQVHHPLELDIYPFREVAHAAVDTADYGSVFQWVLVDFGGTIELWDSFVLLKASLEVCQFILGQGLLVSLEQKSKLIVGTLHAAQCCLFG